MLVETCNYCIRNIPGTSQVLVAYIVRNTLKQFQKIQPDPSRTVIVCGAPRSGTTWLTQLLAAATESEIVFEPFAPQANYFAKVKPSVDSLVELETKYKINSILTGKSLKLWLAAGNTNLLPKNKYILKTVHGGFLLPYLFEKYANPIILIERNPYATVYSQLNSFGGKEYRFLSSLLDNKTITNTWLKPYVSELKRVDNLVEEYAAVVAIERYYYKVFMQKIPHKKVSYELLVSDTKSQIEQILEWLDMDFKIRESTLFQESFTSFGDKKSLSERIEGWKTKLSKQDKKLIKKWLLIFSLNDY